MKNRASGKRRGDASDLYKPPVQEQITEWQKKIQLLEGDRKAYYESSQWSIKRNKDQIDKLREGNKELHKTLALVCAGDDRVLDKAFEGRHTERIALKNKTSEFAIDIMDTKVSERKKKLNSVKAASESKRKRITDLQVGLKLLQKEAAKITNVEKGDTELRLLENRLDKQKLKSEEAEHISKVYTQIKSHLEYEQQTFHCQLDGLDKEIVKARDELDEVQQMQRDAERAREDAREELGKHETRVYKERREREQQLNKLKKLAEEKKAHAERVERRNLRDQQKAQESLQDTSSNAELTVEDQEKKIDSYEEAFVRIKEATGVSGIQEVVARFRSQGETQKHLENLKKDNVAQIHKIQEEKFKLQQQFEEMKYSGEAKLSSGQRILEEFQSHIDEKKKERDDSELRLEKASDVLVKVKAGVGHLADKLQHLKATKSLVPNANLSPASDEFVLNLLAQSEEKLLKLLEELDGAELPSVIRQMEDNEFHTSIENKLPSYNTRIDLPTTKLDNAFDDSSEESGEDDTAALSRAELKRRAQQLIDAKTKKGRNRPRKKKQGKY